MDFSVVMSSAALTGKNVLNETDGGCWRRAAVSLSRHDALCT